MYTVKFFFKAYDKAIIIVWPHIMDFLDPKKKRNRKIRLTIGHTLVGVLVFIATYILVFQAYGYEVDKHGQVIQNGLVYIDSAPDNATIKINGQDHKSNTNTRQALPEGHYTIELSKSGYRNWSRSFDLEGGEVLRYTYPTLFPDKLEPDELQAFDTIGFSTQSPNRRWVLLAQQNSLNNMTLYDLEERSNEQPTSSTISLPAGLFTAAAGQHALKLAEWSTDNRHVLIQHNWSGGQEFVMLDIEQPTESYNVNKTFNRVPTKVSLFDKSFEKLYLYDEANKALSIADLKAGSVQNYATGVVSYKSHGDDTVLMAVVDAKDATKANVVIRQKDKTYQLRQVPTEANIPLDIARFDGSWYAAIGVQADQKTFIYKNPMELNNQDNNSTRAIVLRNNGPIDQVAFSQNARFIMSSSGHNFSVYDAEAEKRFIYNLTQPVDAAAPKPYWMDGHRIIVNAGGKTIVFDYDGINQQTLVDVNPAFLVMFDRDYTELYSVGNSTTAGKSGLFLTELRQPEDR